MKSLGTWAALIVIVGASIGAGYWLGHRGAAAAKDAEHGTTEPATADDKPVAKVQVTPIQRTSIAQEITAYGTVIAPASEIRVVSVPYESHVTKMLVTPGQVVSAQQPLVEVEGSAATRLAAEEARNAAKAAQKDVELVQQRFGQNLATNAELYAAQSALRLAEGRLSSLEKGGALTPQELKTEVAGVVSKVDVQIGQIVPIGGPLVEVVAQNRIEVRLGAEPEDAAYLKEGQPVRLTTLDDASATPINGAVRMVSQRVDPISRLVDVTVSLPADSRLMLEGFVIGRMEKSRADGLVAPREAVLPDDEGGYTLFTVKDGRAVKHSIKTGIENDRFVQITSDGLKEGDPAVVVGNFTLEDGMGVEASDAPSSRPAPEPSSATPESAPQPAARPSATAPSTTSATGPSATEPSAPAPPSTTPFTREAQ